MGGGVAIIKAQGVAQSLLRALQIASGNEALTQLEGRRRAVRVNLQRSAVHLNRRIRLPIVVVEAAKLDRGGGVRGTERQKHIFRLFKANGAAQPERLSQGNRGGGAGTQLAHRTQLSDRIGPISHLLIDLRQDHTSREECAVAIYGHAQ